jgi:uncharacterized protein DUF6547
MVGLDQYKALLDALVATSPAPDATWVRNGSYPDIPDNQDINALLASLTVAQRDIVARMIQEAKVGGVHDAVVALLDDGGYRLSRDGVELPYQPFGTESHFDYIARLNGQEWPEAD